MALPSPTAGKTHHVVFKYANDTKTIGLMLPDVRSYTEQPYTPFAPQVRQGEASQRDFNVTATWEQFYTLDMGIGHNVELPTQPKGYEDAIGADYAGSSSVGPCLFTAQVGRVYPPIKETFVTSSFSNIKQMLEFNGKVYALTSDTPGKIYEYNGTAFTLRETLSAAGTQLYTNGTTLYACQGANNPVRKTTNGTTWSNAAFNAHCMATREENNLAYVTTNTLVPGNDGTGPTYRTIGIDWSGTAATNMIWFKDSLYIGKPEGLYRWKEGWVSRVVDTSSSVSTINFTNMTVHRNFLYFNINHRLFMTNGSSITEVVPDDWQAFQAIDSLFGSPFGPLFIGARINNKSYLFWFNGVDEPGLNPIWSTSNFNNPITAVIGTTLFTAGEARCLFSHSGVGIFYLSFSDYWMPKQFHTVVTNKACVELTKFTAGFRAVPKWWYEAVFNVENPSSDTFAQVWYSVDDGAWTQTVDENGAPATLTLDAYNKGCYFPLDTSGVKIKVRIYLWTTNQNTTTYISGFTLRGSTMVKPRVQIAFPVLADQYIYGINGEIREGGEHIVEALREMVTQGYPVRFQNPEGRWRLVLFRPPYPMEVVRNANNPTDTAPMRFERVIQILLVEVDELDDDSTNKVWEVG